MAKFYGKIGFTKTVENPPRSGKFVPETTEKDYTGDILGEIHKWEPAEKVNDDLTITNRFSIIADGFAIENMSFIRFVNWQGQRWKVVSANVQRPRLILAIGGVYNGKV